VIFQSKFLQALKSCNFIRVQQRHNCSPAASFANCVMTLYVLKVHLQTFLSISITQKCQILSCDTLVVNKRYVLYLKVNVKWSRYRPGEAYRVGRGIALLFHDRGTKSGWAVSSTPRPHFTHFTGGWVDPRAGLDGRKISFPLGFDPESSSP